MDYKLAKALRDAGFPQQGKGGSIIDPDLIVARRGDRAYVPTLEELIEACGEQFESLVRYSDGTYRACGRDGAEGLQDIASVSSTEAVARLWLALNT